MNRTRRCGTRWPYLAGVMLTVCLLGAGALAPAAAWAASALGPDVLVSASGDDPQVAVRARDHVVVVWSDKTGVMARLYRVKKLIEPRGPAFRVDGGAVPGNPRPRVAMDRDGNFVVVWDDGAEVRAQLFRADGRRRNGVLRVSDSGRANEPRVAMAPDGRFVVAWDDLATGRPRFAAFAADGGRLGSDQALPASSAGGAMVLLADVGAGPVSFAAGWNEVTPCAGHGSAVASAVGIFDWTGSLLRVDRFTDQRRCDGKGPALFALPGSDVGPLALLVGSQYTAQRFSPLSGERVGPRRTLASAPGIVAAGGDGLGRLAVVWQEGFAIGGGRRFEYEPAVQLFGRDGQALTGQLFASALSSVKPLPVAVGLTREGTVVVAWKRTPHDSDDKFNGILLSALKLP